MSNSFQINVKIDKKHNSTKQDNNTTTTANTKTTTIQRS